MLSPIKIITFLSLLSTTSSISNNKFINLKQPVSTTQLSSFKQTNIANIEPEVCSIEPEILKKKTLKYNLPLEIFRKTSITALSTFGLAFLLPPIKELNLLGQISLNHDIRKSIKAIAPIVTFTVNAPPLLNKIIKSVPVLKSLSETKLILLLALIKHWWIWQPENKLNTISTGIEPKSQSSLGELAMRKTAHIGREGLLIYCVKNPDCESNSAKLKSYLILALGQTILDRIAFASEINILLTAISRFLYLLSVAETIEFMTKIVDQIISKCIPR